MEGHLAVSRFAAGLACGLMLAVGLAAVAQGPKSMGSHVGDLRAGFRGGSLNANTTMLDDVELRMGTGVDYTMVYDSTDTQWELNSTDCDGAGADCVPISIDDGTDDIDLSGNLFLPNGGTIGALTTQVVAVNTAGDISSGLAAGALLRMRTSATATVPVFVPVETDTDTGVGSAGADQTTLVAGGQESLTVVEGGVAAGETMFRLDPCTAGNLGTPADGHFCYCSDCTIANPCAGSGTGAFAKRLNGAWVCN